jgi:hypothetical protein
VINVRTQTKKGLVNNDQVHSSLDRYPYREIAAVEWKVLLRQELKNQLDFRTRYSYSVPERGGWLTAMATWSLGALTWSAGLDFLGSDVGADSSSAGLFTRYRANDRVFGGVSYVF